MSNSIIDHAIQTLETERAGLSAMIDALADPTGHPLPDAFEAAIAQFETVRDGQRGRIVVTGIGKSGHIGRKISATFASTGMPSIFVHAAEASHGDLGMITRDDVVLAISNSGETRELLDILHYCARFSIPVVAITSGEGSSLAEAAETVLLLPDAAEACSETRAPTTSTTLALALGDALAVTLLKRISFRASDFQTYHPGGKLGAAFRRVGDIAADRDRLPLIQAETPLAETLAAISDGSAGIAGVVDADGALIGVVTDGDLRRAIAGAKRMDTAGDIMTRNPVTISADHLSAEALGLLNSRQIQAVFITDGKRPTGLLHLHDFLKHGVM